MMEAVSEKRWEALSSLCRSTAQALPAGYSKEDAASDLLVLCIEKRISAGRARHQLPNMLAAWRRKQDQQKRGLVPCQQINTMLLCP